MNAVDEISDALATISVKPKESQKISEKKMQRQKKEAICFYYQKRGHIAKECRKKKKESNNRASTEKSKKRSSESDWSAFVIEAYTSELINSASKDFWLLNSNASKHTTSRYDWFAELQPCVNEHVSLGSETKCKVLGQGTICIVDEEWLGGKLEDVLYVPNLSKNLFSTGTCINKNYFFSLYFTSISMWKRLLSCFIPRAFNSWFVKNSINFRRN